MKCGKKDGIEVALILDKFDVAKLILGALMVAKTLNKKEQNVRICCIMPHENDLFDVSLLCNSAE